jgi:hypothetical protein
MKNLLLPLLLGCALGDGILLAAPEVIVTQVPPLLRQSTFPGEPRVSAPLTLTNIGDAPTTITLGREGAFFTQSPSSFVLPAGASQIVTVTAGDAEASLVPMVGASLPSGNGVVPGLRIPITILFSPSLFVIGESDIRPERVRVEVSAPAGENPTGVATFRNIGVGNRAIVTSDVPWITTDLFFDINDDGTAQLPFTINRALRPDARRAAGSVSGSISMTYETESGVKGAYKSFVTIVDSVKLATVVGPPPPLAAGEVALFVTGVGNVVGSGGKHFLSDVSLLNSANSGSTEVKLYYRGLGGAQLAAPAMTLPATQSMTLADIVKSVFGVPSDVGTLQVRGSTAGSMSVNANVFNVSHPAGTYGTSIPVFRSDRSATPGSSPLLIAGLRRDAQSHTNLYLQETSGIASAVLVEVLSADGTVIRSMPETLDGFALRSVNDVVPTGGVAARITVQSGGSVAAYATPVDDASGDTWAVVDWNRFFASAGNARRVIPVAGAVPGANETYFRTDLALSAGSTASNATVSYFPQSGGRIDRNIALSPGRSAVYPDVVTSLFGLTPPSLGHIVITPENSASLAATSRTYTTVFDSTATYGTSIPAVPAGESLTVGKKRSFAAVEESTTAAITNATAGTYRTNFGLLETSGQPARVRVTLHFFNGRDLATASAQGAKEYDLAPNQMLLVSRILSAILGESRETTFGEIHNVTAAFEVISGTGAVLPFLTTTDNGTGDTVFRLQ